MEVTGFAVGLVGLAGQLIQVSRECSNILSEVQDIGNAHNSLAYELRGAGLRIREWEEAWGININSDKLGLDPSNDRHRHAVECLAMIVATFMKIVELQSKYQYENKKVADEKGKRRSRLLTPILNLSFRSRSKSASRLKNHSPIASPSNASPAIEVDTLDPINVGLLENAKILSNPQVLNDEITRLSQAAQSVQNILPEYRKFRWAITDKGRADNLVVQLRRYLDDLFTVLPTIASTRAVAIPTTTNIPSASDPYTIPVALPGVARNANAVERKDLLQRLEQELAEETSYPKQVVLYGTGGMGKTHLALQYISSHHTEYSSVFFVNAASEQTTKLAFTRIMQQLIEAYAQLSARSHGNIDYIDIALQLGMTGKVNSTTGVFNTKEPEEEQHVIDAVKRWFTRKDNTKWLLILDNVDDLKSFNIDDYIPASPYGGTVIITSRRPESAEGRCSVNVQQMNNSEAEKLIRNCAKYRNANLSPADQDALMMIMHKLGNLPLALEQAGAYIHRRQYSFTRYLKEFEDSITHVLNHSDKRTSNKGSRSVSAAWELSFEAIEEENPEAAELLLLCGYLDNEDILEELLQKGMERPKDDIRLGAALECLFSYSFIKRKEDDSFSLHPLVHRWAQYRLQPERRTQEALKAFLVVTSAIKIPEGRERQESDWIFERRIMPHLVAIGRTIDFNNVVFAKEEVRTCVRELASVYVGHMKLKQAEEWYKWLLSAEEDAPDPQIPRVLDIVNSIASIFDDQGHYDTAIEWYKRALAGYENSLGYDHPSTLNTVNNMAVVFDSQGQYDTALEWYKRALAGYEKSLGYDHPSTLSTVNNMAMVFDRQGQYDTALEWYKRALAGNEKSLGYDHPSTLNTVNNMAIVFRKQGQYDTALEWCKRALAGYEKSLGYDHPSTLGTVNNMAMVFDGQGQYDTALVWYKRALAGYEKSLGYDHPSTLSTVNNMAMVFDRQGQYDTALEWYKRVLAGYEKSLGYDHPSTLSTVNNMAIVFYNQEQYDTALEWHKRALPEYEKSLGYDHPSTLSMVNNMARIFDIQGQYDTALEWYKRALAGFEKSLGHDHPSTLSMVNNMAMVFYHQGQYDTALEWYKRALAGKEKWLGYDHPSTLDTVNNMAVAFYNQGQYDTALKWYKRALAGYEKSLGYDHPSTLRTLNNIASMFESQQEYALAQQYLEQVLDRRQHRDGDSHPDTQDTLRSLIALYKKTNQYQKAHSLQPRLA